MEEIWKDIEGYEGHYQVSNLGRVKSFKSSFSGRIIKIRNNKGYGMVDLRNTEGKKTFPLVHRLVAKHFLKKIEGKNYINHKDGDKLNNRIDNLEWCTHSENMKHAYKNNLCSPNNNLPEVATISGEKNHGYKGPIYAYKNGEQKFILKGKKEIQNAGFTSGSVYLCVRGKLKQHKGFTFKRIKK